MRVCSRWTGSRAATSCGATWLPAVCYDWRRGHSRPSVNLSPGSGDRPMRGRNDVARKLRGRSRPFAAALLSLLVLSLAGCKPSERTTHEFQLGLSNVNLTNAAPQHVVRASLKDDPFYAEHEEDLDSISDLSLRIAVSQNRSSRLRLGVYVSREQETRLIETTKIADFNLRPGGTA